jgi:hypothetical protein
LNSFVCSFIRPLFLSFVHFIIWMNIIHFNIDSNKRRF